MRTPMHSQLGNRIFLHFKCIPQLSLCVHLVEIILQLEKRELQRVLTLNTELIHEL